MINQFTLVGKVKNISSSHIALEVKSPDTDDTYYIDVNTPLIPIDYIKIGYTIAVRGHIVVGTMNNNILMVERITIIGQGKDK